MHSKLLDWFPHVLNALGLWLFVSAEEWGYAGLWFLAMIVLIVVIKATGLRLEDKDND